jgi:hypothetical protein
MKRLSLILGLSFLLFVPNSFAGELTKGTVLSPYMSERINLGVGDKALINLGKADGLIRGDILKVASVTDVYLLNLLGLCVIVDVDDSTSVCEMIKTKLEIGKGDLVYAEKPSSTDPKLFRATIELMSAVLAPYEPHKMVRIYIHNFFNEKKQITKFSEALKAEMEKVLGQKRRVEVVTDSMAKDLRFYPEDYNRMGVAARESMKKLNLDVVILGSYSSKADGVTLSVLKIDKNWQDQVIEIPIQGTGYGELLSTVLSPYAATEIPNWVNWHMYYKPIYYTPAKDEMKDVARAIAEGDPFVAAILEKVAFNLVSPVELKVTVDGEVLDFRRASELQTLFKKGTHNVRVSFKRGFFSGDTLLYTADKELSKEVTVTDERAGGLYVELLVNPGFVKDNIDFKIYKKLEKNRYVLKPIFTKEIDRTIETYKD